MIIRAAAAADVPFILDSWARSAKRACEAWPADATPFSLDHARAVIEAPDSRCLVASHPERLDVIVGWGCARGSTLEYVYVKHAARRCGIARDLVTHLWVRHVASFTAPWTRTVSLDASPC
jgi:hypothetical protein